MKIMTVFGTRPEAIKMCPLILELKKHENIDCKVCLSGQHREMLNQVMNIFHIVEDYNLDIMKEGQTLTTITTDIIERMESVLKKEKPDLVLVHGDTTTSYATALAAFYQQITVGHVEAGLRTGNIYSPFPEEMNRLMIGRLATLHFAPTEKNRQNLSKENVENYVYVTGNTVIDAFKYTVKDKYEFHNEKLRNVNFDTQKIILVTAHRRENLGYPLQNICNALRKLAQEQDDIQIIYPVHLNPAVKNTVYNILGSMDKVLLTDPVDVLDMHNLISRSYMVMTDSGGLQEEAPSFGKPVLVLRTETERPEAVEAGTVKVIGVEPENIYREAMQIIKDEDIYMHMARAVNPYGDGHASERIVRHIFDFFG